MTEIINIINAIIFAIRKTIIRHNGFPCTKIFSIIDIDKSANDWIIVSTLEIIHLSLTVKVVSMIAEWVNICNSSGFRNRTHAPSIISIPCYNPGILVGNRNDVIQLVF